MRKITRIATTAITRKTTSPTGKPPPDPAAPAPDPPPAASASPVGRGIHRTQPVVGRQLGLDELLLDRGQLLLRDRSGGVARQVELTGFRRHREEVLRRSEAVRLGGGVGPVLGARRVREFVDVHDPEVQARVGLELLEPGLCLRRLGARERSDVVEHVAGAEGDGRCGGGCDGGAENHDAGDHRAQGGRERPRPSRTHRSPFRGRAVQAPEIESIHARGGGGRSAPPSPDGRVAPLRCARRG